MTFIEQELDEFLAPRDFVPIEPNDLGRTYTKSGEYLRYTCSFHHDQHVRHFLDTIDEPKESRFIDVGCCSGFTGLTLAMRGYHVTFHDFEGLGLEFIRWFTDKHDLPAEVIPYGTDPGKFDVLTAFDVLEHTGNHLAFVRWVSELAKKVFVCYPSAGFAPPYISNIDQWVDDEGVRFIIHSRYQVLRDDWPNGRRFLIWESK